MSEEKMTKKARNIKVGITTENQVNKEFCLLFSSPGRKRIE